MTTSRDLQPDTDARPYGSDPALRRWPAALLGAILLAWIGFLIWMVVLSPGRT